MEVSLTVAWVDYAVVTQSKSRVRSWENLILSYQEHHRLPTIHEIDVYLQIRGSA